MSDASGMWASEPASRRDGKSSAAFRTISEVAGELDVPQHVLRFWETKFPQVKPLKRAGGRRYYRPEDVTLLRRIRELLYRDGFTIKGAQKLLREGAAKEKPAAAQGEAAAGAAAVDSREEGDGRNAGAPRAQPSQAHPAAPPGDATAAVSHASAPPDRAELKAILDELEALRDVVRTRLR